MIILNKYVRYESMLIRDCSVVIDIAFIITIKLKGYLCTSIKHERRL